MGHVRCLEYITRSKTQSFIFECVEHKVIYELFKWIFVVEVLEHTMRLNYSK